MGNSLVEMVWAENLVLRERCLNSVLSPESCPDPSSPAERCELGERSSSSNSSSCSRAASIGW